MHRLVRIISVIIILLGIVHIFFAFPIQRNTDTLWLIGSGMAILLAGLLNLVAIQNAVSTFTHAVAVCSNALMCGLFCFALLVLKEPQVYFGLFVFLLATVAFIVCYLQEGDAKTLNEVFPYVNRLVLETVG